MSAISSATTSDENATPLESEAPSAKVVDDSAYIEMLFGNGAFAYNFLIVAVSAYLISNLIERLFKPV